MEILLIILGVVVSVAGVAYVKHRRSEKARRIQAQLHYSGALFNQAVQYAISGEYDRAVETHEKSLELNLEQSVVPEPNLAVAYYNKGQVFAEAGRYEEAMRLFGNALVLDPDPAAVHQFQGLSLALTGDYDSAIDEYCKAILVSPDNSYLYYNRAQAHAAKQDFDAVTIDYTEFIGLQPTNAGAYWNRGKAFVRKDDIDRAIVDFNKAVELAPDEVNTYVDRGSAFLARGQRSGYGQAMGYYRRAVEDFGKVIDLGVHDATSYTHRGLAHVATEMNEEGIEDLERAREFDPNNPAAYMNLATAYLREGNGWDAQECLDDLIILAPNCAAAYFMRAAIDYRFDVVEDEGFEALDKAIALASGNIIPHCLKEKFTGVNGELCCLAHAHEFRANARENLFLEDPDDVYSEMFNDLDKIVELTPEDSPGLMASAYTKRGRLHVEVGEVEKGLADLEEAVRLDSANAEAYYHRARAHEQKGDHTSAIDDFTRAIEVNSDIWGRHRLSVVYERAHVNLTAGEYDSAISDYDEVLSRFPFAIAGHLYRAVAYRLKGDRKKARSESTRAMFVFDGAREIEYPGWLTLERVSVANRLKNWGPEGTDDADYWCEVGIGFFIGYNEKAAIEALNRAIAICPDYADAYRNRAYVYLQWMYGDGFNDHLNECLRDFEEAVRLNPDDPLTYYFRGMAHRLLFEDWHKAIAEYTKSIDLRFNKADVYSCRGSAYESLGSYENAIKDYGKAIHLDPEWLDPYELRAEALEKIGEDAKAAEDRRKAEEIRQQIQTFNLIMR